MVDRARLAEELRRDAVGFTHIRAAAEAVRREQSAADCLRLGRELYGSAAYQDRMFATLVLGSLAATHDEALLFLETEVVPDDNWRVQEMLARAFDQYCKDRGYAQCLPVIQRWLAAAHPHQRRAVSEGLRIWTSRPFFKEHPEVAVQLLSSLKTDDSEYVRKSAGNALRDISRRFPALIKREIAAWDLSDRRVAYTSKLAGKFLQEADSPE